MSEVKATLYKLPDGHKEEITIRNISKGDAKFFTSKNIALSAEKLRTGDIVLYADTGLTEEGDPVEVTYVVPAGQPCEDAMTQLRIMVIDEMARVASLPENEKS